jgi:hypothetical protein
LTQTLLAVRRAARDACSFVEDIFSFAIVLFQYRKNGKYGFLSRSPDESFRRQSFGERVERATPTALVFSRAHGFQGAVKATSHCSYLDACPHAYPLSTHVEKYKKLSFARRCACETQLFSRFLLCPFEE